MKRPHYTKIQEIIQKMYARLHSIRWMIAHSIPKSTHAQMTHDEWREEKERIDYDRYELHFARDL